MVGTKVLKSTKQPPPPKSSHNRIQPYIVMQKTAEICEQQHKEDVKKLFYALKNKVGIKVLCKIWEVHIRILFSMNKVFLGSDFQVVWSQPCKNGCIVDNQAKQLLALKFQVGISVLISFFNQNYNICTYSNYIYCTFQRYVLAYQKDKKMCACVCVQFI